MDATTYSSRHVPVFLTFVRSSSYIKQMHGKQSESKAAAQIQVKQSFNELFLLLFFFPLFFLPELAVIPKYIYEYLYGLLGLRHDMKRSDLVSMALNYLWVVEDMRSELLGEVI